ncbi:MAG: LacI family DNA-binding transcriptional regulator [Anaerolineae bacterium]|nr:MAG: LacI family DNA-binding transcriptional regulator [Anaerolineae bacterium]
MDIKDLPVKEVADLYERDPVEIEQVYQAWFQHRAGRKRTLVPDIRLLASLSNLSTASVSNFLRNKPGSLSETNSRRLAALVDLLGYVPSSAAQSLRGRNTNAIGIAAPLSSISPDFYLEILSGIKVEAEQCGYQQLIFDVTTEEARDDFFGTLPFLGIVDGLIAIGLFINENRLRILNRYKLPIAVVHNRLVSPPVVTNVLTENESAFQDLIDHHLIKHHGYRKLALVTLGTSNPLKMGDAGRPDWSRNARINAYRDALQLNDIPFDERLMFEVCEHSFKEGYKAFNDIEKLNQVLPPDDGVQAIVCTSDTLAAGVLTAARRKGKDVPVTGFDNLPLAELLDITTVDQRAKDVGSLAFRHLFEALAHRSRNDELPPLVEEGIKMQVVLRCSCRCPN